MERKMKIKKRKSTQKINKVVEENIQKTDSESDEEDLLKNISNEAESTDDEGIDEVYGSDNTSELSFESDDEGNYIHKKQQPAESDSDGDEVGEDDENSDDDDEDTNNESDESIENDEDETSNDSGEGDEDNEKPVDIIKKSNKSNKVKIDKVNTKLQLEEKSEISKQKTDINTINKADIKPPLEKPRNSKNKIKKSALKKFEEKLVKDEKILPSSSNKEEYANSDTSDEEDIRNTVGNIPMHWYDEYKHIGYDWDAKKIIKAPKGDQIDDFLKKIEDPNFWRSVKDPQTGQEVILSNDDIELIKRINSGRIPDTNYNEYENWIEWFTSEVEKMPIKNIPEHKRSFLPSSSEKKTVSKMVHALKMGWMKTMDEIEKEKKAKRGPKFYMLWETDTSRDDMRRIHDPVSAPKRDLPGHAESYNPPPEYILDAKEMREWEKMSDEPHRRKLHFLPQKYKSLREVPAYSRYLRERFLRCLDLYLCPRAKRMKLTIDAEYLIPKLPSPKDLQPFPTVESLIYRGHTDLIRSVSVEPHGEYIVSGSDDMTVKIWEIASGRCIRTIETGDIVRCVAWCPNPKLAIIAIASGNRLLLLNPKVGDKILVKKTDDLLIEAPITDNLESERIKTAVQWSVATEKEDKDKGIRIIITHFKPVHQVTWHGKGDYFATVMPEGANRSALIHQLSKRRTQIPFSKSKGLIQCVLFHPVKPCLFVATQHNIRIYDLVKQELLKKLLSNSKWISGMAIHPKGDNLLVSTYDKKMLWFDLDLSTKPYQTMRLHRNAVRNVAFHLRYPLFASGSDDQAVIVSHGMVYNDLLQNPLIVPLKKLQTHEQRDEFGVLDVAWHPTQPWVFSTGADATIRLFT